MTHETAHTVRFSPLRLARLSSFRIGSAMAEILVTSIWNRVMISNLGIPAAPVGLLLALRYLLAPLSLWAGHRSDTIALWGYYRTSYIWLGRLLTLLSLPFLGFSLMRLEVNAQDTWGWVLAVSCFLLYAFGSVLSGSPFLALVRDSAPKARQGLAISVTETSLIVFIALSAVLFGVWMENYTLSIFWQILLTTMAAGGFFWFFGVYGIERASIPPEVRVRQVSTAALRRSFTETFYKIWADGRTRRFFIFLSLATLSAWAQDTVLEPFGAEVLNLPTSATTRFNSYWQGATVITLIGGAYLWRKRPPEKQAPMAGWGLALMGAGMALLAAEAFLAHGTLVTLALVIFGAGFGIYTFGGLSLMAVMASDADAGAYLGLWTISILVFKGLGTFLGGLVRDVLLLGMQVSAAGAYGAVFLLSAVGLFAAVLVLTRVDVVGFAADAGRVIDTAEVQAAGVEL